MNHFDVLHACATALNKAREDGRKPACFHLSPKVEESLRKHPMILADQGQGPLSHLMGADVEVEVRNDPPHLTTEDHKTYFIDLPGEVEEEPVVEGPATRLRFSIRVTGEYSPDPAAFGGSRDPARWAAMDEETIMRNLPQFVASLPSLAPDAEVEVNVEPATEVASGVAYALAKILSVSESTEDVFNGLEDLLDAWRQSARGPGAGREFSHAISRLEEARWRFDRGKERAQAS